VQVSIKALKSPKKEAIAQYGSSDSGATLATFSGTALKAGGEVAGWSLQIEGSGFEPEPFLFAQNQPRRRRTPGPIITGDRGKTRVLARFAPSLGRFLWVRPSPDDVGEGPVFLHIASQLMYSDNPMFHAAKAKREAPQENSYVADSD